MGLTDYRSSAGGALPGSSGSISRTGGSGESGDKRARLIERYYPEVRFGGFTDVDGTVAFYTRVHALIADAGTVVDVGCGRGAQADDPLPFRRRLRDLRSGERHVIGIDVDEAALSNPYVHEPRLIDESGRWPLESATVDACIADFVLEHVAHPDLFLAECRRVLRPGGVLCIRTINARSYVGIGSRLTPVRLHRAAVRELQSERHDDDVFPTFYRCNTRRSLTRTLRRHGFEAHVYTRDAEPSYLERWPALYRVGVWHQRFAPRALGVAILAYGRKLEATPSDS
jgi:SAM-dependent methyltransferase